MNFFQRIQHILILPCSEASRLIEKRLHAKTSFMEKLQLDAHMLHCKWCASYQKKAIILDAATKKLLNKQAQMRSTQVMDTKEMTHRVLDKITKND